MDVAVSVTVAGLGTFRGGLYVTEDEVRLVSVPQVLPLQPEPDRDHVTPWTRKSLFTVAVKACDPYPDGTDMLAGETLTVMGWDTPLRERKAARPAPQVSTTESVALAEAVPAEVCNWSSVASFVFGADGTDSSKR
jgi:hypothetical protein